MKKAGILAGVVITLIIGAGWYFIPRVHYADTAKTTQTASSTAALPEREFSWKFSYTDSTEDGLPRTDIALISNGDIYDVGAHAGSCSQIEPKNLLPNEVSAVLCWWAGGGDELGVFKEGAQYVVKQGTQDEGTDEELGSRGGFEQLFVIGS